MKLSQRLALGATSFSMLAAATVPVFAASNTVTPRPDHRESLIQGLVQRFGLKEADLNQFFQEQEQKHFDEMLVNVEQRLAAEVTVGRLTEAQKTAIVTKAKEMKTKFDALRALSQEERKQKMDAYRTELEAWATQNNIPRQYLRLVQPQGGPGHMKGGKGRGEMRGQGQRGGRGMFGPMRGQVPQMQN